MCDRIVAKYGSLRTHPLTGKSFTDGVAKGFSDYPVGVTVVMSALRVAVLKKKEVFSRTYGVFL